MVRGLELLSRMPFMGCSPLPLKKRYIHNGTLVSFRQNLKKLEIDSNG